MISRHLAHHVRTLGDSVPYPREWRRASQPALLRLRLPCDSPGSRPVLHVRAFSPVGGPTMPSADFCLPIPARCRAGSTWQEDRSPRVMRATFLLIPAAYTSMLSVQVSGFEDIGLLTQHDRLVCDFCSSGQHFACGFLRIPSRDGHPCRPASSSPCRACGGLSPPSHQAGTTPARMVLTHHAPCRAHERKSAPEQYSGALSGRKLWFLLPQEVR